MAITSPESNIPIPEKENKQLENIREQIHIGEQKVRQLQSAERKENAAIQVSLETKSQIESLIESLKTDEKALKDAISPLKIELPKLTEQVKERKDELATIISEIATESASLNTKRASLDVERSQFENDKASHAIAVENLASDRRDHEARIVRLNDAMK